MLILKITIASLNFLKSQLNTTCKFYSNFKTFDTNTTTAKHPPILQQTFYR